MREKGVYMKIAIVILIIETVLAGCAGINTKSGKYLHIMNPINSRVILQLDYQSESACRFSMSVISRQVQKENPEMSKYVYCNDISFASSLPFRAATRDNKFNTTDDGHFISLELCNEILNDSKDNPNTEVIVPCHRKQ
jgi:hypothetical protein